MLKLLDTVQSLRKDASPHTAILLEVLAAIPENRLAAIMQSRNLCEGDLDLVAKSSSVPYRAVADVLRKFVQFDCANYDQVYIDLINRRESIPGHSQLDPRHALNARGEDVMFMLHESICSWSSRNDLLIGIDLEDDMQYLLTQCELIRKRLAFPTTLILLECSFRSAWPGWYNLWKKF